MSLAAATPTQNTLTTPQPQCTPQHPHHDHHHPLATPMTSVEPGISGEGGPSWPLIEATTIVSEEDAPAPQPGPHQSQPAPVTTTTTTASPTASEEDQTRNAADDALLVDSQLLAEHLLTSYRELQTILTRVCARITYYLLSNHNKAECILLFQKKTYLIL